jgi:hypothetical protein
VTRASATNLVTRFRVRGATRSQAPPRAEARQTCARPALLTRPLAEIAQLVENGHIPPLEELLAHDYRGELP